MRIYEIILVLLGMFGNHIFASHCEIRCWFIGDVDFESLSADIMGNYRDPPSHAINAGALGNARVVNIWIN